MQFVAVSQFVLEALLHIHMILQQASFHCKTAAACTQVSLDPGTGGLYQGCDRPDEYTVRVGFKVRPWQQDRLSQYDMDCKGPGLLNLSTCCRSRWRRGSTRAWQACGP